MLTIVGMNQRQQEESGKVLLYPSTIFDEYHTDAWLDSEFGRDVISDIQQIDVHDNTYQVKEILLREGMLVTDLATGTKNVLNCRYLEGADNFYHRIGMMGENCFRWVMDAAEVRDFTLAMTVPRRFQEDDLRGRKVYFKDLDRYADSYWTFLECLGGLIDLRLFQED